MKRLLTFISLLFSLCAAGENGESHLGRGFSLESRSLQAGCLEGKVAYHPSRHQDFGITVQSHAQQAVTQQWRAIAMDLELALVGLKRRLEYLSQTSASERSISISMNYSSGLGHLSLTPSGRSGDSHCEGAFVESVELGSQLSLALVLDFESRAELQHFRKQVHISLLGGLIARTRDTIHTLRKLGFQPQIRIAGLQRGGQPERLAQVLAEPQGCSMDHDPAGCEALISRLFAYIEAEGGYRQQITDAIASGDLSQLAVMSYSLGSYYHWGLADGGARAPRSEAHLSPRLRHQLTKILKTYRTRKQEEDQSPGDGELVEGLKILKACYQNEESEPCLSAEL